FAKNLLYADPHARHSHLPHRLSSGRERLLKQRVMSPRGMIVVFALVPAGQCEASAAEQETRASSADQAQRAVAAAEQAVQAAARRGALWTTARDALARAKAALENGDYVGAVERSRFAEEQAQLGIAQLEYP